MIVIFNPILLIFGFSFKFELFFAYFSTYRNLIKITIFSNFRWSNLNVNVDIDLYSGCVNRTVFVDGLKVNGKPVARSNILLALTFCIKYFEEAGRIKQIYFAVCRQWWFFFISYMFWCNFSTLLQSLILIHTIVQFECRALEVLISRFVFLLNKLIRKLFALHSVVFSEGLRLANWKKDIFFRNCFILFIYRIPDASARG